MKNTPYEGTHVQPAVKPEELEEQLREQARRKRQAARNQRRRERAKAAKEPKQETSPTESSAPSLLPLSLRELRLRAASGGESGDAISAAARLAGSSDKALPGNRNRGKASNAKRRGACPSGYNPSSDAAPEPDTVSPPKPEVPAQSAPKPEPKAKTPEPNSAPQGQSDVSLSERSPAKRVREEKGRGKEQRAGFRGSYAKSKAPALLLRGGAAKGASFPVYGEAGRSGACADESGAQRVSSDAAAPSVIARAASGPWQSVPSPPAEPTKPPKEKKPLKLPQLKARREQPIPMVKPVDKRKRRIFLLAAVGAALMLALLAFFLTRQSDASRRRDYMAQAEASYQAGDYDAALRSLRRAEQLQSDEACLILMADCYQAQGKLEKALEVLRRMDASDESVTQRIAQLEALRQQQAESVYLTVAGRKLAPDTRDLLLDSQGLTDAVLPEIAQLYALDSLSLMDNDLEDIGPLSVLGGLDTLNLSGNRIADLSPLSRLTELRTLYLDGNPLTDLSPLYALHNLTTLSICGIELDTLQLQGLAQALPDCAIRSDTPRSATMDITLGSITFKSDVTELDLSGSEIHDIRALSACTQLRFLDLSGNAVSDLTPLMNLPTLETLDIRDNLVTDLRPLMGLTKLRTLNAAGNRIADTAAVGAMAGLTALDLSGNPLTDLSGLRKLTNLHSLSLKNTGLYDGQLMYVQNLSLLANLFLDDNPGLSNEAIGQLQSALPGCHVSFTELVYTVSISGFEQPSNAKSLDLSSREIVDITGIDQMTELETVDLSGNNINNIYILQYSPSRDTIRTLNLADNRLADISALASLTAIESLDLRINNISSLTPLMNLQTLRLVYLGGNPLSEQQVQALREALPDCTVSLE